MCSSCNGRSRNRCGDRRLVRSTLPNALAHSNWNLLFRNRSEVGLLKRSATVCGNLIEQVFRLRSFAAAEQPRKKSRLLFFQFRLSTHVVFKR